MKFRFKTEKDADRCNTACRFFAGLISAGSIKRLFLAWISISAFCLAVSETVFTDMRFFSPINLPILIASVACLWLLFFQIKNEKLINLLLIASSLLLAVLAALEHGSFPFLIGLCVAVSLVIMLTDMTGIRLGIPSSAKWTVTAILAVLLILTVGISCCISYRSYRTSCYDFGIFSQMFYYMKETGLPLTTCERDGLLSHFAVHVSPVFYLLLPIYAVFPFPETLLIMQILILASGVIPLLLICKHLQLSDTEGLLFAVCYLAYPTFTGGSFYYFHENCFLAPLIMWLIYFSETDRTLPSVISAILLLSVKEDAAVYLAVIALYFIFTGKSRKRNLCLLALSVAYFITVTRILAAYGDGVMTWRYNNYMYDGSQGLFTLFKAIAINPVYVISQCFTQEKLIYILQMLIPLGFLPIMVKNPKGLILMIPFVLINLMTNYVYQYDIGFQYGFGSGATLIYLSVINYSHMKKKTKAGKTLAVSAACALIVFIGLYSPKLDILKKNDIAKAERLSSISYALELIPDDASVCASTFFLPNLSQRDVIYELESTKQKAEYYVLDLRYATAEYSIESYPPERYETIYIDDDVIAIFRDTEYTG